MAFHLGCCRPLLRSDRRRTGNGGSHGNARGNEQMNKWLESMDECVWNWYDATGFLHPEACVLRGVDPWPLREREVMVCFKQSVLSVSTQHSTALSEDRTHSVLYLFLTDTTIASPSAHSCLFHSDIRSKILVLLSNLGTHLVRRETIQKSLKDKKHTETDKRSNKDGRTWAKFKFPPVLF